jgi:plasmid stabilization system protein ParE
MAVEQVFTVVIAHPALIRYQENILSYLFQNFSFERALEIDNNILRSTERLKKHPHRGRKEEYLKNEKEEFRFVLHKETRHFDIKIMVLLGI